MDKAPKHKIALAIGVVLFVSSPFLFLLTPDHFFKPLLCGHPDDTGMWFACTGKIYTASLYLSVTAFIAGTILILCAFRLSSKPSILSRWFHGRYRKLIIAATAIIGILSLYVILLTSPFTSSWFQYPYYRALCGKEPVIVVSGKGFSGPRYITPEMKDYQVGGFNQRLFCSVESARAFNNSQRPDSNNWLQP